MIATALAVSILAAAPAAAGAIPPPLSPRNASYAIDARLDPATRTITGSERITWRNISTRTATDLQFHLYWNAWRDTRSTWLREARLTSPTAYDRRAGDWARIDVDSIAVTTSSAPVDVTASGRFISPDDGNPDDQTVLRVPLADAIAPGGTAIIDVRWRAHVPRPFERTGAIGNVFFLAQWFPKIGVLQDDGWNCHQFHRSTEFFADYGIYDVSLTVPSGWIVGATGVERERDENADRTTTRRFHQEDVHDFAWTTSPDYVERRARFEHPTLPAVDLRLLLQPEHASQAERHFDAARTALASYGEWFGPYRYGHLTIVDPAYQSEAGGMEYPTLITAGTRWIAPAHVPVPESVTVHEAGHQFWYGVVGTNEFEHAWMDEGLNEFSEARAVAQAYQPQYLALRYFGGFVPYVMKDIVLDRELEGNRYRTYRLGAKSDTPSRPSYTYFPSASGPITYSKTALWLNTMERWLGWPVLQRTLSTYYARWQFKHPTPHDFFDVVTEVAGRDLGWFFDQVYRSSNVFDYGIAGLASAPEGGRFRTTVIVRRYGEAIFPVDVAVAFRDGSRVVEHWDGRERWTLYTYDRPSAVLSAVVDPDRVLLLDIDYTNNSRTLEPKGPEAATKWSLKWMVWLQDWLLSWSTFV